MIRAVYLPLLFALALPSTTRADDGDDATPFIAVLPLLAHDDVSEKEAAGVTALLRARFEDGGFVELLDNRRDDKKSSKKCDGHPTCLQRAARDRGVDFLLSGELTQNEEGVEITVRVSNKDEDVFVREVSEPMGGGEEGLLLAVRRLAFRSVRPDLLLGEIAFDGGPEGAKIRIDGAVVGALPLDAPVPVVEGRHRVVVQSPGYKSWRKTVNIVFEETVALRIALTRGEDGAGPKLDEADEGSGWASALAFAPYSVLLIGAVTGVATVLCGGLAYWDRVQIENRARDGQLEYPRDQLLLQRGPALGVAAFVFAGLSVLMLGAGGTWAVIHGLTSGEDE